MYSFFKLYKNRRIIGLCVQLSKYEMIKKPAHTVGVKPVKYRSHDVTDLLWRSKRNPISVL